MQSLRLPNLQGREPHSPMTEINHEEKIWLEGITEETTNLATIKAPIWHLDTSYKSEFSEEQNQ